MAVYHNLFTIQLIILYSLYDDELQYVDRLISDDMRNNSAWNERFFVVKQTGITDEVVLAEITYVLNRIRLIKNNESPWNYLRGILLEGSGKLSQYPQVSLIDFSVCPCPNFMFYFYRLLNFARNSTRPIFVRLIYWRFWSIYTRRCIWPAKKQETRLRTTRAKF